VKKLFEFDAVNIANGFIAFKRSMSKYINAYKTLDPQHVWGLMRQRDGPYYPTISVLVFVMFFIPVQTADVERGFSVVV
jgi:hypothetical protein